MIENIRRHLENTLGDRYPFSSRSRIPQVEEYVLSEFRRYGLATSRDEVQFNGAVFSNLIAEIPGSPDAVIVAAHHDAVEGSPGADDNASGLAALLQCAQLLAGRKMRRTVRFISFHLEEFGMIGSADYVRRLKAQGQSVAGMVSLEMIGYTDSARGSQQMPAALKWKYPDRGDFIGLVANGRSKQLLDSYARALRRVPGLPVETLTVPFNGWVFPATRLSDHSPFWDAGYPALLVTDTSFFRNPHYHLPSDTLSTLDLEFIAKVTEGVAAAVEALAASGS
ncbi:MAG: M28 family peptidase [Candidatus Omnitrophica bacterium]|nr:M28 family peptidase [Candidatus Omnitrophota bacterium]